MFVWNEVEHGVRPVEGRNGSFGGRETQLAACTCPAPKSVYVDNGQNCLEQSMALHEEHFGGLDITNVALILGDTNMLAELVAEAEALVLAIQSQRPLFGIQVMTTEDMLMLGFTREELGLGDYNPEGIDELRRGLEQEMIGDLPEGMQPPFGNQPDWFNDAPYTEWDESNQ